MYFGYYFGGPADAVEVEPTPDPTPIPSPITSADPVYVGHVANAIKLLPEQFRRVQVVRE